MPNSLRNVSSTIVGVHAPAHAFIARPVKDIFFFQNLISRFIAYDNPALSFKRHTIGRSRGPLSYSSAFGLAVCINDELAERWIRVRYIVTLFIGVRLSSSIWIINGCHSVDER